MWFPGCAPGKPSLLNQIVRSSCSLMFQRLNTSRRESPTQSNGLGCCQIGFEECQWLSDSLAHLRDPIQHGDRYCIPCCSPHQWNVEWGPPLLSDCSGKWCIQRDTPDTSCQFTNQTFRLPNFAMICHSGMHSLFQTNLNRRFLGASSHLWISEHRDQHLC